MASIRERTSQATGDTTYSVLFRQDGKQRSRPFPTRSAAEKFQSMVNLVGPARANLALNPARAGSGLTVDDLFEKFIAWKRTQSVTPRTIKDYRRDFTNWIQPTFGHRPANSVDEVDVQDWVDSITGRLDAKTVADRHMILHGMFRYGAAKSRRIVDQNPCLETELPRRRKKPPKGATLAEWYAIRDAAYTVDQDAAELLEFVAATGWRWSEAAALIVSNVDDFTDRDGHDHMVAIMGAVWRRDDHDRYHLAIDEAKSEAGHRATKIPPRTAAILRRRIVGKAPGDLVFTNRHGRRWWQNNFLERTWTEILDRAGLGDRRTEDGKRITPHYLRHTQVAILNKAGASMAEIQRRLGHASIGTTFNVYGGMINDISDDALDALDELLSGEPAAGQIVAGQVVAGELEG